MRKWIAVCLSLALALTGLGAFAQETQQVVLATVNGEPIYQHEADQLIPALLDYQYIQSAADYETAVDYLVQQKILGMKITEMQFDVFTDEEKTAFENEAQTEWDSALAEYVDYYLSEDTDEARATLTEQAVLFYETQGFSKQAIYNNMLLRAGAERMAEHLTGVYQPTELEIDEVFQSVGANYQQKYENNVQEYEFMTQYNGEESWYTPAGYRGVIHILLTVDQALLDNYSALQAAYEEQQSMQDAESAQTDADAATAAPSTQDPQEPVTIEMVEKAKQDIFDSIKETTDAIYARLAAGESFESLIAEYGQDPGMQDETMLSEGYSVHASSVLWDPAFTQGTFADNMLRVGDVSSPVIGVYGVHIIKYLRDVPSGLIMTDAIHDEIVSYLLSVKENEAFTQAYAEWEPAFEVVKMQEAIDAAAQKASETLSEMDEPDGAAAPELPLNPEPTATPAT